MPHDDWEAEWRVLDTEAGVALLEELARHGRPIEPREVAAWRRIHDAEEVAAALRIHQARVRAKEKFSRWGSMWVDEVGVEQSTSEPVAVHKARGFAEAGAEVVVDLCCGIGGDALALAGAWCRVLAVDVREGMARRTRWNAGVYAVGERVQAVVGRAEWFGIPAQAYVHVDPDRRAGDGRRRNLAAERWSPPAVWVREELMPRVRGGAVKLSPVTHAWQALGDAVPLGVEYVSRKREVKEQVAWFGELRREGETERATMVSPFATFAIGAGDVGDPRVSERVKDWIHDPDPALDRRRLLPAFAVEHGLEFVAAGCRYLTSDGRVETPLVRSFRVLAEVAADDRRVREALRAHDLRVAEVKTSGRFEPAEALGRRWRTEGSREGVILCFEQNGKRRVVVVV